MPEDQWSTRNSWLNQLSSELFRRANGHIRNAAFEATADDTLSVCGDADSYYGVQIALLVVQHCRRNACPFRSVHLALSVGDGLLEIVIPDQQQTVITKVEQQYISA